MVSTIQTELQTKYDIAKNEVCEVIEELFGDFIGDFLVTKANTESSIRKEVSELANVNVHDIEKYVYFSTIDGSIIIKK